MIKIAEFPSRLAAERERNRLIRAQETVDAITEMVQGRPVEPPAKTLFQVIVDGRKSLLYYDDPSVPEDAA